MNSPVTSKWPFRLVIVSLAANMALLAAIIRTPRPPARNEVHANTPTNSFALPLWNQARIPARQPVIYVTNAAGASLSWSQVESTDYEQYAANLRALGCPEQIVRDIITADIMKLYGARVAVIYPRPAQKAFWQRYNYEKPTPEQMKQLKALDEERRALLERVLGQAVSSQQLVDELFLQDRLLNGHLGFLPADKREAAHAALRAAEERRMERMMNEDEERDWSKRQRTDEKERLAELSRVLSPEELDEFHLRTSNLANTLRGQLADFEITPDEFRAVLKLKEETEDASRGSGRFAAKQKAEVESLKALFGSERYAEYERGTNLSWRNAAQIAEEQGLARDVANRVFEAKKTADAEMERIRAEKVQGQQRTEQMAALKARSEQAVRDALGEAGFKSYRRQGGIWLNNLR